MTYASNTSFHPARTLAHGAAVVGRKFWAGLSKFATTFVLARSRSTEIEAYRLMSDAELAKRGLTRDGIVAHVFRDRMGY
jgi:hypothetical protein